MSREQEELKITKERVLSAAGKCGTAKEVLKELFPEAFESGWRVIPPSDFKFEYVGFMPKDFVRINHSMGSGVILLREDGTWQNNGTEIKIENGHIWREKS